MDSCPESPAAKERSARGLRGAAWRRLSAISLLLTLEACTGGGSAEASRGHPFEVAIIETRACPVPETLDKAATRVVGVKVRVTSRHQGNVPANYFYGSILTKDDQRWLAGLPGCAPVLSSRPLEPGESSEGFLNFAVPKDVRVERIAYAPRLEGSIGADRLDQRSSIVEVTLP